PPPPPPTHQGARCASALNSTRRPARVISDQVCGWCQCTHAPPYSTGIPSHSALQVRPPSRSRASSSSTERPRRASSRAAVTPAKPPPTTITSRAMRGRYGRRELSRPRLHDLLEPLEVLA